MTTEDLSVIKFSIPRALKYACIARSQARSMKMTDWIINVLGAACGLSPVFPSDMTTSLSVKSLRESLGLTQAGLALRLGVTTNCVEKWESDAYAHHPSPSTYEFLLLLANKHQTMQLVPLSSAPGL